MALTPEILVVCVAVMAGILTVLLVVNIATNRSRTKLRGRVSRVTGRWTSNAAIVEDLARVKLRKTQDNRFAGLEGVASRFIPRPALLRNRLLRTGFKLSIGKYIMISIIVGVVASIIRMLMLDLPLILGILFGIVAGAGLPHMAVGYLIKRREKAFLKEFPEAIELIIRGLKSGLPVPESIRTVGEEFTGPVGQEFRDISDRLKFGQSLDEALWDAADRIDIADFRFFVISLSVQKETGGNLAETLENLSDILRKRRQMKLKIKAMSSEASASAMILGSLPFIMFMIMYVVNSAYISTLWTDPRGTILIVIGLGFIATGVGVMVKMVRFEI